MGGGATVLHFVALAALLLAIATRIPDPALSDRPIVEQVGQRIVIPGCSGLPCFRILAATVVESFPGPSLLRWRTYAALANAAGAVVIGHLALALGVSRPAALLAVWLSAVGAGSFTTLSNPYTSDPLIFVLAPFTLLLLVSERWIAALGVASVGVFAKEFAAAPLFIYAGAAGYTRDWDKARRGLWLALGVTALWVGLQLLLIQGYGYRYGDNPSVDLFRGGYFWFWFRHVEPLTALATIGSAFGAVYLLAAAGLARSPERLRALATCAVPAAIALVYVETPDRALHNFSFLLTPVAATVLTALPAAAAWLFVGVFGLANLRFGTAWTAVPEARYPLALSILLALLAVAFYWRTRPVSTSLSAAGAGGPSWH